MTDPVVVDVIEETRAVDVDVVDDPPITVVEVGTLLSQGPPGPPGVPGPQGPEGPPGIGASTGAGYDFVQGTPVAVWHITHNLGFHPNVTVVDSADTEVEGTIAYTGLNSLTVTFSAAFSGKAYLS